MVLLNESSPISIVGDVSAGIFDPSLTFWNSSMTLMTYSSVTNTSYIHTRLAMLSAGSNASLPQLTLACDVNSAVMNMTVPCGGGAVCNGSLIHEVSSILALPAAMSASSPRLVVVTHTYIVDTAATPNYTLGHIRAHVAACDDVCACGWTHVPLLGWDASGPYFNSDVQQNLNRIPELASCLAFSEPGLLFAAGRVLLGLTCINATNASNLQQNIILLTATVSDTSPTFLTNFTYATTLLYGADMPLLTFNISAVSAPDLFADDAGNIYLIVSPFMALIAPPTGYFGCLTFPLQPAPPPTLYAVPRVPGTGEPIPVRYTIPSLPFFSGACTALPTSEGIISTYFMPVLLLQPPNATFTIFATPYAAP